MTVRPMSIEDKVMNAAFVLCCLMVWAMAIHLLFHDVVMGAVFAVNATLISALTFASYRHCQNASRR